MNVNPDLGLSARPSMNLTDAVWANRTVKCRRWLITEDCPHGTESYTGISFKIMG